MQKQNGIDGEVGRALLQLRSERNMTANHLAQQANLSRAMISRIENGHVSPSLNTLQALADALNVPIMALFTYCQKTADVHHVKAGQGLSAQRVTPGHAHDYLLLGRHAGPGGSFQSAFVCIQRDDAGTLPRYQHEGNVFIYVIKGQAVYACGPRDYTLAPGDSLSFDAKLPHGIVRLETETFDFVTVSTRPE